MANETEADVEAGNSLIQQTAAGGDNQDQRQGGHSDSHVVGPIIDTGDGQWTDWTSTWRRAKSPTSKHMTMKGTITRGSRSGQSVDIQLDLTERELAQMTLSRNRAARRNNNNQGEGGVSTTLQQQNPNQPADPVDKISLHKNGVHIMFFGLFCSPFVFLTSLLVSSYFFLLTWMNIFNHLHDERSIWHRILLCPLLIIAFPLLLILINFPLAIYAALEQITWSFDVWRDEMCSFEKGFYGWLCAWLGLDHCSPYTVIELQADELPQVDESTSYNEHEMLDVAHHSRLQ